jgi:hypothetical protein
MNLPELAEHVGELAQRTRLNAINLAVAAAKVKLSDPGFKSANERIIQLVTRATEVAGRVDRLTRQMSGEPQDEDVVESGSASLEKLETCMHDVQDLSGEIVAEVRRLSITVSKGRQETQAETPKGH